MLSRNGFVTSLKMCLGRKLKLEQLNQVGYIMTILYYRPEAIHSSNINKDWLYGLDLIRELQKRHIVDWTVLSMFHLSKMQVKALYASADCLLRPTRHDGYSFSVQEALHYGLPVLHTYPIPGVILIKPEIKDIEEKLCQLALEL